MEATEHEARGQSLAAGAGAAFAAAVAGAIAWGLIVRWTDYEVGIVAWAIGWLAGTAAVLGARGARGAPLQAAAVVAALVGVLLGKYLGFAWAVQESVDELGPAAEVIFGDSGLFSGDMRAAFRDDLDALFGWFDLLWVGLAAFTAWRVPARPAPAHPGPPPSAA